MFHSISPMKVVVKIFVRLFFSYITFPIFFFKHYSWKFHCKIEKEELKYHTLILFKKIIYFCFLIIFFLQFFYPIFMEQKYYKNWNISSFIVLAFLEDFKVALNFMVYIWFVYCLEVLSMTSCFSVGGFWRNTLGCLCLSGSVVWWLLTNRFEICDRSLIPNMCQMAEVDLRKVFYCTID